MNQVPTSPYDARPPQYVDDVVRLGLRPAIQSRNSRVRAFFDEEVLSLNRAILGFQISSYQVLSDPQRRDRICIVLDSPYDVRDGSQPSKGGPFAREDELEGLMRKLQPEFVRIKSTHKVEVLGFVNGVV